MTFRKNLILGEILLVVLIIGILIALTKPSHPPYDHPLHTAIRRGNVAEAKRLIEDRHTSLSERGHKGFTPLHYAVLARRKDLVKLLVDKGADVNGRDTRQSTPLHAACLDRAAGADFGITQSECASIELVKLLVLEGADLNAENCAGRTPLSLAEEAGHDEVVKFLIAKGAKKSPALKTKP